MSNPAAGGCACSTIRYELRQTPLFVHGCHCSWCQRETGSAFAINLLIETDQIALVSGQTLTRAIKSSSGAGQTMVECPTCGVVVWSHYSSAAESVAFVRAGTLDNPNAFPPDIHIFTETKQSWFDLPKNIPAVPEYYRRSQYWSKSALERYRIVTQRA